MSEKMPAPTPGTVLLGKYRVERVLGEGGMGVVLEATHVVLNKSFALKVLNPDLSASPDVLARFMREAQIAAQLPADHIAHVTDVGQTETGAPYLVMELLAGQDLDKEIAARGKLPIDEAIDYVLQACEGVAEAHAVGLVHRDLKPANLFRTRRRDGSPVIKVLDFGLSKVRQPDGVTSLTITNSTFGTPQYMSPEQVRDSKHVDARCDQHALAMILYELLTGLPPYDGMNVTELVMNIALKPPPHAREARPEVPEQVDRAIVRALAKEPDARFPDLGAFAREIAPFATAKAQTNARNVAAILAGPASAPARPGAEVQIEAVPPHGDDSDAKLTLMRARPGDRRGQSVGAVTSSASNLRKKRTNQVLAAVLATGAGVLAIGGVVTLVALRKGPPPETRPAAVPAAVEPPAAAEPPPPTAAPVVAPDPSSAAAPGPAATASATASASGPRTSPPPKGPIAPKPPAPKPKPKPSDIDIFGGKR